MNRSKKSLLLAVMAFSAIAALLGALIGCSEESQYRILSLAFEDVPKPGEKRKWEPFVGQPLRPPPPIATPEPPPEFMTAEKVRHGREWLGALLPTLPPDKSGNPDMAQALNQKLITPRAAIAEDAKDSPPFNMNVVLEPKGVPSMKVVFPHKAHTQWLRCPNCHPSIFQMKKGADPITMGKIFAGQYCARCHGKVAFAVPSGCARCHTAMGGKKQQRVAIAAPADFVMKRATADPDAQQVPVATFPHTLHRVNFKCYVCHEAIFKMKARTNLVTMEAIGNGKFCGACHNGTTAFAVGYGTCDRCHRGA